MQAPPGPATADALRQRRRGGDKHGNEVAPTDVELDTDLVDSGSAANSRYNVNEGSASISSGWASMVTKAAPTENAAQSNVDWVMCETPQVNGSCQDSDCDADNNTSAVHFESGPHVSPGPNGEGSEPAPERFCRICYDDEDGGEAGFLFSPCKCSGSAGLVHVNCLNTWRAMSTNASSAFKCDMCKYEYKLGYREAASINLARVIGHRWFSEFASFLVLFGIVVMTGLLMELLGWSNVLEDISFFARVLCSGTSTVGMLGLAVGMPGRIMFHYRDNGRGDGWMVAIMVVIGLCYSYYYIYQWVNTKVRATTRNCTFIILDVNGQEPGRRGPPPRPSEIPEVD